jgi:hypothetical protein
MYLKRREIRSRLGVEAGQEAELKRRWSLRKSYQYLKRKEVKSQLEVRRAAAPSQEEPTHGSPRLLTVDDFVDKVNQQLGGQSISSIYLNEVLSQRTRQFELGALLKNSTVEILQTLLGIELKVGRRRLLCPDLATARYLSVFARAGCDKVAVPYDITRISRLADQLETSWHRTQFLIEHLTLGRSARLRSMIQKRIARETRLRITELGAGAKFPQFNQKVRQRKRG